MNKLAPGQSLELSVDALALGGKAVCRHEGCVIFVDHGLPGQRLLVQLTSVRKRFAEATLVEVLSQGPETCTPFCTHFGSCGGCTWQDLPYPSQLAWKERFVHDSLRRIGGIEEPPVLPALASPRERGFRNKMEFAFASDAEGVLHLGLRQRGAHTVVDVTECHLQTEVTQRIVNAARELARASALPAWDDAARQGFWRFLVVREPATGGQCLVQCITSPHPEGEAVVQDFFTQLQGRIPEITGCVHSERSHLAQVAYGERTVSQTGKTRLFEDFGPLRIAFDHDSFLQTNTSATQLLYGEVARMAALTGAELVWDLYGGVGSIALWLAPHAAKVRSMEMSEASVAMARENAETAGCMHCTFKAGDVRKLLRVKTRRPDVVVIDPPRAGMHPDVIESLLQVAPARIVYVSCDPATMARDIALLRKHYTLHEARPVDLFPQTPHVETVALLSHKEVDTHISSTV